MTDDLLSANEAARRLGITTATLYDWLAQSDVGTLIIRGQLVTINYFQGGTKGQGRIKLEVGEIERLKDLMRVRPQRAFRPTTPIRRKCFPGISVKLGLPRN